MMVFVVDVGKAGEECEVVESFVVVVVVVVGSAVVVVAVVVFVVFVVVVVVVVVVGAVEEEEDKEGNVDVVARDVDVAAGGAINMMEVKIEVIVFVCVRVRVEIKRVGVGQVFGVLVVEGEHVGVIALVPVPHLPNSGRRIWSVFNNLFDVWRGLNSYVNREGTYYFGSRRHSRDLKCHKSFAGYNTCSVHICVNFEK